MVISNDLRTDVEIMYRDVFNGYMRYGLYASYLDQFLSIMEPVQPRWELRDLQSLSHRWFDSKTLTHYAPITLAISNHTYVFHTD